MQKADKVRIDEEEKCLVGYHFSNLPTTERMNKTDCMDLRKELICNSNLKDFLMVSLGVKPMSLISTGVDCNVSDIKSDNFDVLETGDKYNNIFIFNKCETRKNIESNRYFITQKMNLPKNTDIDEIYSILIGKDSPINTSNPNFKRNHDLIGVLLGFPMKESIIFQLENMTNLSDEDKLNIPMLKSSVMDVFFSTGLYDNFDDKFKADIIDSIKSIDRRQVSDKDDITYTKYFGDNNNDKEKRLLNYQKRLEEVNNLGMQRAMHSSSISNGMTVTDDNYNHLMMFEFD